MTKKLHNAPVFYTLAQIKFNPIVQMDTYVPKIQDELRRSGYPDFNSENQFSLAVRRLDTEQPEINTKKNDRWSFSNSDCTEGYLLLSNALVFHTTAYDSFEDFSEKLIQGLELIQKIIGLSYIESIGLRYLNAVSTDTQNKLEDYLSENEAERVLRNMIDWGRYAEIFAYDFKTGFLSLENPGIVDVG